MKRGCLLISIDGASGRGVSLRGVMDHSQQNLGGDCLVVLDRDSYAFAFDNALEGMYFRELEGRLIRVNRAMATMFGYDSPQVMAATVSAPQTYVNVDQYHELDRIIRSCGSVSGFEIELRTRQGERIWGQVSARVLTSSTGVRYVEGSILDVTEHVRAREALKEWEMRCHSIMEASAEPLAVHDTRGNITYVNSAFTRVFGWDPSSFPEKSMDFIPPACREEFKKALDQVLGGQTLSGLETRRMTRDGRMRDILLSAASFSRDRKSPLGAVVNLIDVTERKNSELRFRDLFNSISDFVFTMDTDGRILSANPATCQGMGMEPDELVGLAITSFMDGNYRQIFFEEIIPQILRIGKYHGMMVLMGSGGRNEYLEFRSVLQHDDTGDPVISSTGRFVTERILAEKEMRLLKEQLVQAQKMEAVGTLTTGISHDFNNLLQAIIQPIQLALKNQYLDYKERRFLDIAAMSAKRGADLVQQLLTFSRKVEPRFEAVNLPDVVEQAMELLKKTLPKNIRIRTVHGLDVNPVSVDPSQVQQMIMNLGINARDAMPQGGSLVVETTIVNLAAGLNPGGVPPGEYSVVTVKDTGCGILEAIQSKIFEPFFTTKDKSINSGLGLSMVYGIMKTHNGAVTCDSASGRGSVFRLYFPACSMTERTHVTAAWEPGTGTVLGEGCCVLMVEDEEYIREIVVEVLKMSGYTVLEAVNGKQALEIYADRGHAVDLVVLDLNMPVMGGKECLMELLRMDPEAKVVVATGSSDMNEIEEIRGLGARGIINKPYTSAELLREVNAFNR